MYYLEKTALWLTVIGSLNWGLIGLFDYNLVAFLFGNASVLSRIIYTLIGFCAVWTAYAQILPAHTEHRG